MGGFWLGKYNHYFLTTNNSSIITSSYISTTIATTQPKNDKLTFTFAGDAMFGREIGYQFQNDFSKLFENFGDRVFWGTDIAYLNLEGPISDKTVIQQRRPDNLVFNFSRETIDALKYLHINTVGLANNHTYNQGKTGFEITQKILEAAGIKYFGSPIENNDASIARFENNSIKISLIAINALTTTSGVEKLVQEEKAEDRFVIVLPHWGNEYQTTHSQNQENLAKSWIEAGADLIIGAHPHVIQDAQIIDEKPVFYSLGNFVFDQTFSQNTQQGLILSGEITRDKLTIIPIPIESKNLKPELLQGEEKQKIINTLCQNILEFCNNNRIELTLL